MIPIALILMLAGIVLLGVGVNREIKGEPIEVGQQWLSNDPFAQHLIVTVIETNGDWVKYTQSGDRDGTFRSTLSSSFRAWYPNRYIKAQP